MNSNVIRKNIRSFRLSSGITQREIAARLFMDERTYSKIERGTKKSLDVQLLASIADVLNTNVGSLMADTTFNRTTQDTDAEGATLTNTSATGQGSLMDEIIQLRQEVAELIRCHKQALDMLQSVNA